MSLENTIERIKQTNGIPDVIALGVGVATGFLDSRGILIQPYFNVLLKVAPTGAQTILGAYLGIAVGLSDENTTRYLGKSMIKGAVSGAALGAVETGLGYCIGHTIGNLTK